MAILLNLMWQCYCSFNFKAKITGQNGNNGTKEVEIMVPLNY